MFSYEVEMEERMRTALTKILFLVEEKEKLLGKKNAHLVYEEIQQLQSLIQDWSKTKH